MSDQIPEYCTFCGAIRMSCDIAGDYSFDCGTTKTFGVLSQSEFCRTRAELQSLKEGLRWREPDDLSGIPRGEGNSAISDDVLLMVKSKMVISPYYQIGYYTFVLNRWVCDDGAEVIGWRPIVELEASNGS